MEEKKLAPAYLRMDFEHARSKHFLFKSRLRQILYGAEADETPVLSHFECDLGKWIYGHALARYGHIKQMAELERVHADIHTTARQLVALYKAGEVEKSRKGLAKVEEIADRLVALLTAVEEEIPDAPDFEASDRNISESALEQLRELQRSNVELDKRIREQSIELFKTKERFELASKATHDVVWDWDLVNNKVWWNENYFIKFGYENNAFAQKPESWYNYIHPEDRDKVVRGIHDIIDNGQSQWSDHYRFRKADGTFAHIYDRGYALHDEYGKPYRMVGSMQDISMTVAAENALKESEKRFRATFNQASVAMAMGTLEGEWITFNEAYPRMFGYSAEELRQLSIFSISHPDEHEADRANLARMRRGEITTVVREKKYLHKDGSLLWGALNLTVVKNDEGTPEYLVSVVQDITLQHKAMEERRVFQEMEKKSRAFQDRLMRILEDSTDFIGYASPDGKVLYINNAGLAMAGLNGMDEAAGRSIGDFFLPEDKIFSETIIMPAVLKTGHWEGEFRFRNFVSNTGFPVYYNIFSIKDPGTGDITAFATVSQNLSSRKRAEESYRFLTEALPQKVWTANAAGEINFTNTLWLQYTGLSVEVLKEQGWQKIVHPDDLENYTAKWKASILGGTVFELEHRLRRKDGEYRWHLSRGLPQKDEAGNVIMWVGTNTDIDDQKATEQALEKRVQERTSELQESNIKLQRSNEELEQFAYIASHDLQEPLRKIKFFINFIMERFHDEVRPNTRAYLEKMASAAVRMSDLMRNLLDYSRLSHDEPFLQDVDLNQVLNNVILDFELLISQKEANIQKEPLPVVQGIPLQLNQLFYNLLGNALKFSKKGVKPEIKIWSQRASPETIGHFPHLSPSLPYHELLIEDNGIGFGQEYAEQIFDIFQRLNDRSLYGGYGIGLALCRKIVANHQGALKADGVEGKGAVFTVILPVTKGFV